MSDILNIPIWFVVLIAIFPLAAGLRTFRPRSRWRGRAASRALNTLCTIPAAPLKFGYLRELNPFTFEEMILTALEHEGHSITRNRRCTGDGGVDPTFQELRADLEPEQHAELDRLLLRFPAKWF